MHIRSLESSTIAIFPNDGKINVRYHKTVVVQHDPVSDQITLNMNGWDTRSTRRVMNLYAEQLPHSQRYNVFRKRGKTFLRRANGEVSSLPTEQPFTFWLPDRDRQAVS